MLGRVLAALALLACGAAAGLALHLSIAKGDTMFAGKRPNYLGVKHGRLARPRSTPNCVSSQADPADGGHYIEPIRFEGSALEAIAAARNAVESMPRGTVIRHEGNYLYAEFRSRVMGFVDDVEFTYDEKARALHVRSASRLGRGDWGVNRARVEALRARIEARFKGQTRG
ncbi:MAG: DUF1499 domain-containing protein [Betaproteobacteria bacterium]|nr:DUF1499 domain-containing protein [Betaproteobacteria bacterium]